MIELKSIIQNCEQIDDSIKVTKKTEWVKESIK